MALLCNDKHDTTLTMIPILKSYRMLLLVVIRIQLDGHRYKVLLVLDEEIFCKRALERGDGLEAGLDGGDGLMLEALPRNRQLRAQGLHFLGRVAHRRRWLTAFCVGQKGHAVRKVATW